MNTFQNGERVIIIDGPFLGMEGQINKEIDSNAFSEDADLIGVIVRIFERDIPIVLESWQVKRT